MTILNRRSFLRGASAAIAVPAMTSLLPAQALALEGALDGAAATAGATTSQAPLRAAFIYFPNGAIQPSWWPQQQSGDYSLSPTLKPLQGVKSSVQVLKGLDLETAEAGKDGAGDHARGNGTFLTGVRLNKSATDIRAGISIDQVIANRIGDQTRFRSLELTCDSKRQSGECDSGYSCAYQYNMSWKSPTTPMMPEANPRLVFERLFGSGSPKDRRRNFAQRLSQQKSVLDFVMQDARAMQHRLQYSDRQKLDEYLTSVRSIEKRIQRAEQFEVPSVGQAQTPAGVPESYRQHIALMFDLMRLAFETDSTRVATFSLAHDGSNRSFQEIDVVEGHHELSHHKNNKQAIEKIARIDKFYVEELARFLTSLEQKTDTDGNSILHNSMIVYGSGNADGNRHTHTNLPVLLAGNGGGTVNSNRLVDHGSKPLSNLYLSIADRMGLKDLKSFGDSTGRLDDV